jgi:hypothetical protein
MSQERPPDNVDQSSQPSLHGLHAAAIGFGVGLLVTIPAAVLAIVSGSAGHGDFGFARLLFPFPMLATRLTNDTISFLSMALALAQFPLYGTLIGFYAARRESQGVAIVLMIMIHAAGAVACIWMLPNFS